MPPFVSAECTNAKCRHLNRLDVAELRKGNSVVYKKLIFRGGEEGEEFSVVCEQCGQKFKITLKGGEDGKKKSATRGG